MRKILLKTAVMALALMLMLSAMVSCDMLTDLFGGGEEDNTPIVVQHTVTFDLGGGVASEDFEETATVIAGATVTLPEVTREGHTFLGWFVGENEFTAETPVNTDTTVTAKWQVNKVTVTFLDYYDQLIDTQVIDWGTAATAPAVEETAADMVFMGWDIDITCIKGDVTVRPIYDYKTYTVTFNVGAGATAIEPQIVRFGSKPTKPEDPDKMGNSLVGWYLDSEFTTECLFDTAFDADTTLYAKYINDYHTIRTAEDLIAIKDNPDWKYVLLADISLGGNYWTPIENFSGALDGNGHKIYDFTMTTTEPYLGFINQNSGLIKNLKFDDFRVAFDHTAHRTSYGGVIAAVNTGTIKNCEILNNNVSIVMNVTLATSNSSYNSYLGALVGLNQGVVTDCVNRADTNINITSGSIDYDYSDDYTTLFIHAASAVGYNAGTIKFTEAYGKLTFVSSSIGVNNYDNAAHNYFYIGGITGTNASGASVLESASNVQLSCEFNGSLSTKYIDLGLIVGHNNNQITDCYANGSLNVSSTSTAAGGTIGGAVGINETMCKIENVYADVDITVGDGVTACVGGLLGQNKNGAKVNKTVYTGNITLGANVGVYGFVFAYRAGEIAHCYYNSEAVINVNEAATNLTECTDGTATATETLLTENFLYTTLQWDKDIWSIVDGNAPTLNALN